MSLYPLDAIRADFPLLTERIHGKRLAYLDNAATTQKPQAVIDAIVGYYRHSNANVHRAVHTLSGRATAAYEGARTTIAAHFGVATNEVVLTRGATESINLVARSWLAPRLRGDDEVLVSSLEHHANLVSWQLTGAKTIPVAMDDEGVMDLDDLRARLNSRTRLIAVSQLSNALGVVNPIAEIVDIARQHGIPVLVDGSQAVAHQVVNLPQLGADFYVFSSHKLYGPTGFGCLWAKAEHLADMPPLLGGGDMIKTVAFSGSTFAEPPYRFEAGTPDMAGAIGLAAAIDYVNAIGLGDIYAHETALAAQARAALASVPGLRQLGRTDTGILAFVMDGLHPQDLGSVLDMAGVAVRTGHHCAMPLMNRLGVTATTRASLACYSGADDIAQLVEALHTARRLLS